MGAQMKKQTREMEKLFLEGKTYCEIAEMYGVKKDTVVGVIYRARQHGRVPRPEYTQPYDDRRNSYIHRGTVGRVLDVLTKEQHAHLTEVAIGLGVDNLAEMIGEYLADALSEEMNAMRLKQ